VFDKLFTSMQNWKRKGLISLANMRFIIQTLTKHRAVTCATRCQMLAAPFALTAFVPTHSKLHISHTAWRCMHTSGCLCSKHCTHSQRQIFSHAALKKAWDYDDAYTEHTWRPYRTGIAHTVNTNTPSHTAWCWLHAHLEAVWSRHTLSIQTLPRTQRGAGCMHTWKPYEAGTSLWFWMYSTRDTVLSKGTLPNWNTLRRDIVQCKVVSLTGFKKGKFAKLEHPAQGQCAVHGSKPNRV